MKLVVAISLDNDECSLNNRAWHDDNGGRALCDEYVAETLRDTGCVLVKGIVKIDDDELLRWIGRDMGYR